MRYRFRNGQTITHFLSYFVDELFLYCFRYCAMMMAQ